MSFLITVKTLNVLSFQYRHISVCSDALRNITALAVNEFFVLLAYAGTDLFLLSADTFYSFSDISYLLVAWYLLIVVVSLSLVPGATPPVRLVRFSPDHFLLRFIIHG